MTGPGLSNGESGEPWQEYDPGQSGRCWSVPKTGNYAQWIEENLIPGYTAIASVHARLDALSSAGLINWTQGGYPRLKRYLAASKGEAVSDFIGDIQNVNNRAKEHVGYPTQKPLALLKRIIQGLLQRGRHGARPLLRVCHRLRCRRQVLNRQVGWNRPIPQRPYDAGSPTTALQGSRQSVPRSKVTLLARQVTRPN